MNYFITKLFICSSLTRGYSVRLFYFLSQIYSVQNHSISANNSFLWSTSW